ncbi:MAG: GHKL domain-containing protein [Flavobacteriaceae bacterium]|nr:MAG: GHKL domain-containing protein [Flavobacteriaceae bacterium]
MILLVLLASVLIVTVTIYQYDEQTKEYQVQRFGRKEENIKKRINLELQKEDHIPVTTEDLVMIFQKSIYEISYIHNLDITIYDLKGVFLKASVITNTIRDTVKASLSSEIISELAGNEDHRILKTTVNFKGLSYQSSYTYLKDITFKPIGILRLQFTQDNAEEERELQEFLSRLGVVYFFMFLIAIAMAYFLSSYITQSLKTISDKMHKTRLNKRNEKIILDVASSEIITLVEAYNNMIDELEESAVKLAQSEREQAWREMAKQVAHEIKNPLTPMRLSVQSFERKFDPEDKDCKEKLKEYSETLIQQIDVMSSIASAFSDFAKMPQQKKEEIEIIAVVKMVLDIFNEAYISYIPEVTSLHAHLDKTQLIRIVTNLIKNAIQAVEGMENPKIDVEVRDMGEHIKIDVSDNGKGIKDAVKHLIFEPKFTTKTSGMGLGLPMIKNIIEAYDGSISFISEEGIGTVFTVILPKT